MGPPRLQHIDPSNSAFFADRSLPVGLGGLGRPAIAGGRIGSSDRAEVDRAWRLLRDEASRLDGEMRREWLSASRIS